MNPKPGAFKAILVGLLFLALALSGCNQNPDQAGANATVTPTLALKTPTPQPTFSVKSFSASNDYDYGKYVMHSDRLVTQGNQNVEATDEETITNKGSAEQKIGVAEIFPSTGANDVGTTVSKNGEPLESRHLQLNPLIKLTDAGLAPKESVSFKAFSANKNFSNNTPVRLITDAELTAMQRAELYPALSKIAELNLGLPQAMAIEKTINAAFAKIKQQQNAFEDYVDAVSDYADEVADEIDAAESATPPKPTPDVSKMVFPVPTPPKQPTEADLEKLLPQFPASAIFNVTEARTGDVETFYLKPTTYLGELLYSVGGNAAKYLKVSTEQDAIGYLVTVSANVKSAVKDGKIPFDSVSGQIELSFSMLPNEKRSVPVTVKVNHVDTAKIQEEIYDDPAELPAPNPELPETKPPGTEEPEKITLSGNCGQDRAKIMAVAEKYANGAYPGDCENYAGHACACSASNILIEAGVPISENDLSFGLHDDLISSGKGVEIIGPTENLDLSNLMEGDLVFFKTVIGNYDKTISHVEIYAGDGMTYNGASGVKKRTLRTGVYNGGGKHNGIPVFEGAVRVVPSCLS